MDLNQIQAKAPSVFAERPREGVSERYAFIPTTRVLNTLVEQGWKPVYAAQSGARTPDGHEFAKHVLRFRRETDLNQQMLSVGDSIPELVLTNSHNGKSAFELFLGIFRLVCSNGMVVADASIERHSVRHVGYTDEQVIEASQNVLMDAPKAIERVNEFSKIELLPAEREAFAASALTLKYEPGQAPIQPSQLLTIRRMEDRKPSLWETFNVVQENLIKGGLRGRTRSNGRTSTREVKSVNENLRLNKALWQLAESMRTIKAAGQ